MATQHYCATKAHNAACVHTPNSAADVQQPPANIPLAVLHVKAGALQPSSKTVKLCCSLLTHPVASSPEVRLPGALCDGHFKHKVGR